jgi:hypothetical protein
MKVRVGLIKAKLDYFLESENLSSEWGRMAVAAKNLVAHIPNNFAHSLEESPDKRQPKHLDKKEERKKEKSQSHQLLGVFTRRGTTRKRLRRRSVILEPCVGVEGCATRCGDVVTREWKEFRCRIPHRENSLRKTLTKNRDAQYRTYPDLTSRLSLIDATPRSYTRIHENY